METPDWAPSGRLADVGENLNPILPDCVHSVLSSTKTAFKEPYKANIFQVFLKGKKMCLWRQEDFHSLQAR